MVDVQTCPGCRHLHPSSLRICPVCGLDAGPAEATRSARPRVTGPVPAFPPATFQHHVALVGLPADAEEPLRAAFALGGGVSMGLGSDLAQALARLESRPHLVLVDVQLARTAPDFAAWRAQVDPQRLGVFGDLDEAAGLPMARTLGADFYVPRPGSPIMFVAKIRFALSRLDRTA
jgi:hypothetical protein